MTFPSTTTHSVRRVRNRRLAAEQEQRRSNQSHSSAPNCNAPLTKSPTRTTSPTSLMMSMSSVHAGSILGPSVSRISPPPSPGSGGYLSSSSVASSHSPIRNYNARQQFFATKPPTSAPPSPSRSWDEGDRMVTPPSKIYPHANKRQPRIVAELGSFGSLPANNKQQQHIPLPLSSYPMRRVHSSPAVTDVQQPKLKPSSYNDEDLPSLGSSSVSTTATTLRPRISSLNPHLHNHPHVVEEFHHHPFVVDRPPTPEHVQCFSPALSMASSTGSATTASNHSHAATAAAGSNVQRMIQAIEANGMRPSGLTVEEIGLWDAIQVAKLKSRQEGVSESHVQQEAAPQEWETRFMEIQEQAVLQQRDNSRSLQAIQRVLASVQAERDKAIRELQEYSNDMDNPSISCANSDITCEDRETMQRDLHAMAARIKALEQELEQSRADNDPVVKVTIEPSPGDEYVNTGVEDPSDEQVMEYHSTRDTVEQLQREKQALQESLDWKDKQIRQLEQQLADYHFRSDADSLGTDGSVMSMTASTNLQIEKLRRELEEKASALENAKMIIGSLENASGSLTTDLRLKLKNKTDEVEQLKKDVSEKQRTLDRLATELRDLQRIKMQGKAIRNTEAEHAVRLELSSRLEANLAEVRAAAVILEATQDPAAVSQLSDLLTDSANALKQGINVIENGVDDEAAKRDPLRIRRELEEKKKSIKHLEELLRKERSDADRFRKMSEIEQQKHDEEIHALHAEIKILRQQCNTNMEVLTRKERELAVLRDSLRVEDGEVGYISDDEPEDDVEEETPSSPNTAPPNLTHDYGPSQAEALATLLAHGRNHSFDSGSKAIVPSNMQSLSFNDLVVQLESMNAELAKARSDNEKAQRALKVEKESLSNAKMIISSLERANKSMMEDLRARLQDSNAAIASLLEKSMESEKTSAKLRAELESFKKSQGSHLMREEETALVIIPPTPAPLLLTETID